MGILFQVVILYDYKISMVYDMTVMIKSDGAKCGILIMYIKQLNTVVFIWIGKKVLGKVMWMYCVNHRNTCRLGLFIFIITIIIINSISINNLSFCFKFCMQLCTYLFIAKSLVLFS